MRISNPRGPNPNCSIGSALTFDRPKPVGVTTLPRPPLRLALYPRTAALPYGPSSTFVPDSDRPFVFFARSMHTRPAITTSSFCPCCVGDDCRTLRLQATLATLFNLLSPLITECIWWSMIILKRKCCGLTNPLRTLNQFPFSVAS
jgi:hypothetical protein